jgi:hypothetical protein
VIISLQNLPPEAAGTRRAVLQNHINENFNYWADAVEAFDAAGVPRTPDVGDISTGMLYLSKQDAVTLHKQIVDFCNVHALLIKGTAPYEFTFFAVRTGEEE